MTKQAVSDYLRSTDHVRDRLTGRELDWAVQPAPFKVYDSLEEIPLAEPRFPEKSMEEVLWGGADEGAGSFDLRDVSALLKLGAGVTAERPTPTGTFHFRAQASAGALYPCEVYLACRGVEGLADGLHHYRADTHALHCLCRDDLFAGSLTQSPRLRLYVTGIFWRSAWKYGDRAYRYMQLDAGHMVESLWTAALATGVDLHPRHDFDAARVARLLAVDPEREYPLAVLDMPGSPACVPETIAEPALALQLASKVSRSEGRFPHLEAMHRAVAQERRTQSGPVLTEPPLPGVEDSDGRWTALRPAGMGRPFADIARQRRSRRSFVSAPIPPVVLHALARPLCVDAALPAPEVWFAVSGVRDMPAGLYRLDRAGRRLFLQREADVAQALSDACLNQAWLSRCSVQAVFVDDPARCGSAGYAEVLQRSGMLGQRLYLAATALGLGCCGVGAMYDEEAARTLELSDGRRPLYVLGMGLCKENRK